MRIYVSDHTMAVLRSAAKAKSIDELEELMRWAVFRDALREFVDQEELSRKRAAKRKEARRWTPEEDEFLRCNFRDGIPIGPLAEKLGRSPHVVHGRMVKLGFLRIAHICRGGVEAPTIMPMLHLPALAAAPPMAQVPPPAQPEDQSKETLSHDENDEPQKQNAPLPWWETMPTDEDEQADQHVDWLNQEVADLAAQAGEDDEELDELLAQELCRQEAERRRIREAEDQYLLEQWQEEADREAAQDDTDVAPADHEGAT